MKTNLKSNEEFLKFIRFIKLLFLCKIDKILKRFSGFFKSNRVTFNIKNHRFRFTSRFEQCEHILKYSYYIVKTLILPHSNIDKIFCNNTDNTGNLKTDFFLILANISQKQISLKSYSYRGSDLDIIFAQL